MVPATLTTCEHKRRTRTRVLIIVPILGAVWRPRFCVWVTPHACAQRLVSRAHQKVMIRVAANDARLERDATGGRSTDARFFGRAPRAQPRAPSDDMRSASATVGRALPFFLTARGKSAAAFKSKFVLTGLGRLPRKEISGIDLRMRLARRHPSAPLLDCAPLSCAALDIFFELKPSYTSVTHVRPPRCRPRATSVHRCARRLSSKHISHKKKGACKLHLECRPA